MCSTGASTTESLAFWTYRGTGRVEKRLNGNDTYLEATFDSRKLVSTLVHKHIESPSDQKIAEFAYGYDDAARMTTEAVKIYNDSGTLIADKGLGYFYDRAARLTKLYRDVPQAYLGGDPPTTYGQKVEYALDDNANRTTAVYTPQGGSASTEVYSANNTNAYTYVDWPGPSSTNYEYDKAGNRTWQTDTDKSWYYDYQNKLVKVQNGSLNFCEYDYDALGRRMHKHFEFDGEDYLGYTRFYYAGAMLIQEWNVFAENEESEVVDKEFEYVWGLSAAEPVQLLKYDLGTGSLIESVYYHQNALASVYAITKDSANAEIRENYRYEEYGVPTINATDTNTVATTLWGNKLLWHTQYYDFEVVNLSSGLSLFWGESQTFDPELAQALNCRVTGRGGWSGDGASDSYFRPSPALNGRMTATPVTAASGGDFGDAGSVFGTPSSGGGKKPGSDSGYRGPGGGWGSGFRPSGQRIPGAGWNPLARILLPPDRGLIICVNDMPFGGKKSDKRESKLAGHQSNAPTPMPPGPDDDDDDDDDDGDLGGGGYYEGPIAERKRQLLEEEAFWAQREREEAEFGGSSGYAEPETHRDPNDSLHPPGMFHWGMGITVPDPNGTRREIQEVVGYIGAASAAVNAALVIGIGCGFGGAGTERIYVTRWGRPGLQHGDWVMKGGRTLWNYLRSGKYQPASWPGGNVPAAFEAGTTYSVPAYLVQISTQEGIFCTVIKGLILGQRVYVGF